MSFDPQQALDAARLWRDRGNKILILALVAEVFLEIWHDRHNAWVLWSARETTQSLKWRIKRTLIFLRRRLPSKHSLMIIAALIVVVGVGLETIYGKVADDISDQMRLAQQRRIADAETEQANLESLIAGRLIKDNEALRSLVLFAGTPLYVAYCKDVCTVPSATLCEIEESTKVYEEAHFFAASFNMLEERAHWKFGESHFMRDFDCAGPDVSGVNVYSLWTPGTTPNPPFGRDSAGDKKRGMLPKL
jgi:hypothetical protein